LPASTALKAQRQRKFPLAAPSVERLAKKMRSRAKQSAGLTGHCRLSLCYLNHLWLFANKQLPHHSTLYHSVALYANAASCSCDHAFCNRRTSNAFCTQCILQPQDLQCILHPMHSAPNAFCNRRTSKPHPHCLHPLCCRPSVTAHQNLAAHLNSVTAHLKPSNYSQTALQQPTEAKQLCDSLPVAQQLCDSPPEA